MDRRLRIRISQLCRRRVAVDLTHSPPTPTMAMLTSDGLAISCGTVSRAGSEPHPLAAYSDGAKNAAASPAAVASVVFSSPSMGAWEATSDRSIPLALTTIDTDADGAVTGTRR